MEGEFSKDLQAALKTRPVIEQAKGVLIGLRGSTPDQAFAELQLVSQTHNLKLNALASGS
jgi:AmiR/NasT family two-component response regulator